MKFAAMTGVAVSKLWSPEVTHVIAATDQEGACTRTFKVLMAILHGRWVLNINCENPQHVPFSVLSLFSHLHIENRKL